MENIHSAFVRGFGIGAAIGTLLSTSLTAWALYNVRNEQPTPDFKVVGNYKGCEVVRFTPSVGANFQYFMDCQRQK